MIHCLRRYAVTLPTVFQANLLKPSYDVSSTLIMKALDTQVGSYLDCIVWQKLGRQERRLGIEAQKEARKQSIGTD